MFWELFKSRCVDRPHRRTRLESLEPRQLLHGGDVVEVGAAAEGENDQVSDFSLVDVNPNSETYNQAISPRDYLGEVSAWYFGHAT